MVVVVTVLDSLTFWVMVLVLPGRSRMIFRVLIMYCFFSLFLTYFLVVTTEDTLTVTSTVSVDLSV